MKHWTIRRRLWTVTLAVAVFAAIVFHAIFLPRASAVLVKIEQHEIQRQLHIIEEGIRPFVLSNQYGAIYELLKGIQDRHDDWVSLVLTRADGRQIFPLGPHEPVVGPNILDLEMPITARGELWGELSAQVDLTEDLAALRVELQALVISAMTLLLSFSVIASLLLDRLITSKLNTLAVAAKRLGDGDFGAELPEATRDEIGQLAASFDAMRDHITKNIASLEAARSQAESALATKSRFLATMSHELRTPLNGIIPVAEMLKDQDLDREQSAKIDTILKSSRALLRIVDDILDLTRIEEGHVELRQKPFDLAELIGNVKEMLDATASEQGLVIRSEIADTVRGGYVGDDDRLRQILVNLVGNAIKFTRKGSITIRALRSVELAHTRHVLFEVQDTGVGIAQKDHARVFERFEQVEGGLRRRYGGSGLGLSIVKSLVKAMGGELGVKSAPGEGSTFWFSVPLTIDRNAPEPVAEHAPATVQEKTQRSLDVLIADDNEINREVTSALLQSLGHQITSVVNGRDAVDALTKHPFDVVLMDVHMPEMDGLEATRQIRKLESARAKTPVFALTASVMEQDVKDCLEAGMDDVMSKPVTLSVVAEKLGSVRV